MTKRPTIVRLPPKSNFAMVMSRSAEIGAIIVGLVALVFALDSGRLLLVPVTTAIVIGLMFGPVATRLERRGMPSGISAAFVVLLFIFIVAVFALALAAPLAAWSSQIPEVWTKLQLQMQSFREPLNALRELQNQLKEVTGGAGMTVSLDQGSAVESVATLAPAIVAQLLLFFASLYFFVATRNQTRNAILRLCIGRRLRWRVAHIFRDVESSVSRYLLSIALINIGLGVATGLAMWAIGVPSPVLWGVLAGLLNFVVYIGPAVMAAILFAVGLTEFDTLGASLLPPLVFLVLNGIEAQFATPAVIGRTMTMNPFMVILALAFWIWMWGPLGGFIAIPVLLIIYSIISNIVPGVEETGPVRRLPSSGR